MSEVTEQYDAFPYPARDPARESDRLITGSPSHPLEIDHYLFAGRRDWSRPLRALIAGGGTGDALIQLAQVLSSAGRPHEITYLDLSVSARGIAEARAEKRGLSGITFRTGSLLTAPGLGPFDYIDCCGVLHHLPHPQEGFNALAAALAPGGGMGLMVYAPYGRSGVYPLQEAFATLLPGAPRNRLRQARAILKRVPDSHPFKCNPSLVDHKKGDAGFYDLLLNARDRTYTIRQLHEALTAAGLTITGMPLQHLYDPLPIVGDAGLLVGLDDLARKELAEKLRGNIKTHIAYVAPAATALNRVARPVPDAVPHLKGVSAAALARTIAKRGVLALNASGARHVIPVSAAAARLLSQVDGRKSLARIAAAERMDQEVFDALWGGFSDDLARYGVLHYSTLLAPGPDK